MKMNCLSRFLTSSNKKKNNNDSSSSLAVTTKQKSSSNSSFGRAQSIQNIYYKYCNSLLVCPPKTIESSPKILNFNNNNNNNNSYKSMIMSGSGDNGGSFYPSTLHSPGGGVSSPTLTSTPAAADSLKLLDGYVKLRSLDVCFMPAVVLDKIFSKLTDEDVRRVYQVSRSWQNAVLQRPSVNRRRKEFVEKIRQNKENIIKGKQDLDQTDVNKGRRERIYDLSTNSDGKPGSRRVLNDYSNQITLSVPTSANKSTSANNGGNGFSPVNSSTPTSRFSPSQRYEEWQQAERNLEEGQKLFRCKKCYGPVASPVAGKTSEVESNGAGISIAKCRLTARMSSIEENNVKRTRERKKQRSLIKSSPASFPSTHVDISSLGDIMAKRLNISSHSEPEVSSSRRDDDMMPLEESMKKANSSPAIMSSSNTGIDLPISMINNNNSGSLRCNVSNFNFDFSCSTESIVFNSPSSTAIATTTTTTTNNLLSSNNRSISPKAHFTSNSSIGTRSLALSSQNLSDSGFSMSYINSDDSDCNESHLSTIFTPEPVKKSFGGESATVNRSEEGMHFGSSESILPKAVSHTLNKNSVSLHSPFFGGHTSSVYDIIPNNPRNNNSSVNEFRVPSTLNDVSNVNRSLDPMLDSQQQHLVAIDDNSNTSKSTTKSFSLLRGDASTNRSSLIQSPAIRYTKENHSIRCESPSSTNLSSFFPKATFGLSQNQSQSSPLLAALSTTANSNDNSIVLQCPDCSFRFCSACEESEHIGKACRVIDSDSFRKESNEDEACLVVSKFNPSPFNHSGPNSNNSSSMSSKGKGSAKEESKKRLRRLARK